MNITELLEKVTGGSSAVGGRLAAGEIGSAIAYVARLAVACIAFAVALLVEAIPAVWVTIILILCALIAGFDVIASAVLGVMRGEYLNKDLLVIVASVLAFIFGAQIEGCSLILLYQITGIFIDYAVERTRRSVLDTIFCDTAYANKIENGKESTVSAADLQPGDEIVIRRGETVPCDCIITSGSSKLDLAPLGDDSGSTPVKEGEELLSGGVNLTGELRCEVTSAQSESAAATLYATVENAPRKGEAVPEALLSLQKYFTPVVTAVAVLLAALLPIFLDITLAESVRRATMFLVIASPCALVTAIPVIRLCAGCGAARAGVLFDGCGAMDGMASVGTVAFDEAGTLTEGKPRVVSVKTDGRMDSQVLLKIAAHALSYSNSPQSKSVIDAYGGTIYIDLIENFSEVPGYGVEVHVDGIPIRVGTRELMNIGHVPIPDADLYIEDGASCLYVAITNEYAGCIVLTDPVRSDSAAGVEEVRNSGVDSVVMFSADSRDRTAKLASSLGITEYYSECSREKLRSSLSSLKQSLAPDKSLIFVAHGDVFGSSHTAADVDVAMAGAETLSLPRSSDVTILDGKVGKVAVATGIARYARMLSYATAGGAALVKVILLILAAFGISTLWFTVFIDAIAAVAASLISILAFSGELYK